MEAKNESKGENSAKSGSYEMYVSIGQEERQRMYVMYRIPKIYKVKKETGRKNGGAGGES